MRTHQILLYLTAATANAVTRTWEVNENASLNISPMGVLYLNTSGIIIVSPLSIFIALVNLPTASPLGLITKIPFYLTAATAKTVTKTCEVNENVSLNMNPTGVLYLNTSGIIIISPRYILITYLNY